MATGIEEWCWYQGEGEERGEAAAKKTVGGFVLVKLW